MTRGDTLLLEIAAAANIPVVVSPNLADGHVVYDEPGHCVLVGTRPMNDVEWAGAIARHTVRTGMADVLAWCGQTVGLPPERSGVGRRLLADFRQLKQPSA